ncbi:hypothetical protein Q5752_005283 [Cryptotrichosporon argae]
MVAKRPSPGDESPSSISRSKRQRTSPYAPHAQHSALAALITWPLETLKKMLQPGRKPAPARRIANGHATPRAAMRQVKSEPSGVVAPSRLLDSPATARNPILAPPADGSLSRFAPEPSLSRSPSLDGARDRPIEIQSDSEDEATSGPRPALTSRGTTPSSPSSARFKPSTKQPVVIKSGELFTSAYEANAVAGPSSAPAAPPAQPKPRRPPTRPEVSTPQLRKEYAWQRPSSPASSQNSGASPPRKHKPTSVQDRKIRAGELDRRGKQRVDRALNGVAKHPQSRSAARAVRKLMAEDGIKPTRANLKEWLYKTRKQFVKGDEHDDKQAYGSMLLEPSPPPQALSFDSILAKTQVQHVPKPTPRVRPPAVLREPSEYIARLKLEDERKDREIAARIKKDVDVIPSALSPEQAAKVDAAFADRSFRRAVGNADVQHKSLQRLKPGQWLDDEIINFYGQMVSERAKVNGDKVVYFNTFFYEKLSSQGYAESKLARWTKRMKVDIFEADRIVIPINVSNMHWTACVIDMARKRIAYYDSMADNGGRRYQLFEHMRKYLQEEHLDKKKTKFSLDGWVDHFDPSTPQQSNGYDCGVFTCQTLEAAARGRDLAQPGAFEFAAKHMHYLRRLMVYEIATGALVKRW